MTPWFFKTNSLTNEMILVMCGTQNPEETSHEMMIINVSTSPVKCSLVKIRLKPYTGIYIKMRLQYYHLH